MKILRWYVSLKVDPAGFFCPVSFSRYLIGYESMTQDGAYMAPRFEDDSPALYTRKDAAFVAHELRRVGYNVRAVPYLILMIRNWIKARKKNPWKK